MSCLRPLVNESVIHRLDPRFRLLAAVWLTVCLALVNRGNAIGAGLGLGILLALAARLPLRETLRRLLPLNVFMVFLVLTLPWGWPGRPLFRIGSLSYSEEGLYRALWLAVRGNAVLLVVLALVATIEVSDMIHAAGRLRLPAGLLDILVLMVRYVEVLYHRELSRLRQAMRTRCFRPAMSLHTYRSYGYLVGMLLVRSLNRAQRIVEAMKCRGYTGKLSRNLAKLDGQAARIADVVFITGAVALGAALLAGGIG